MYHYRPPITPHFFFSILGICLLYLVTILFYNHYVMLSVDEFWFAHRIYQYKSAIPYRDFSPYKTVLGYYLLLPSMLISSHSIMQTLLHMKDAIAFANVLILMSASFWLTRYFSRKSILISLLILISTEIVLSYSTQIRVDLIGYWFCFFALLFILDKRFLIAGILMGLGFAATQKSIWYVLACDGALVMQWIICSRRFKTILPIILFNLACAALVALYLGFWSWMTDWQTVLHNVLFDASAMYQLDWYDAARALYWKAILVYNPLIYMLWPATLLTLFITYPEDNAYANRVFIVFMANIILCCLIPFKQIFPYYMQVTIPAAFLLFTACGDWTIGLFTTKQPVQWRVSPLVAWLGLGLYGFATVEVMNLLALPLIYLAINIIPLTIVLFATASRKTPSQSRKLFLNLLCCTAIAFGFIPVVTDVLVRWTNLDGDYQKAQIHAVESLLTPKTDYVAGIELVYNRNQPIAGMRHLMGPAIAYLYHPTNKLKAVMLDSLYEDPQATSSSVIQALDHSSVKFYVNNYRINALPPSIKAYLQSHYAHWWGSIYFYAPQITNGHQLSTIQFTGSYQLDAPRPVAINDRIIRPGEAIYLSKGTIASSSDAVFRLRLIPDVNESDLNPHFQEDEWERVMY